MLAQQPAQGTGRNQEDAAITKTPTATATTAQPGTARPTDADAIRPFQFKAPQEALDDLRRRILATKWPGRETVSDASQGVPLATMQKLARYWSTDYDWRKVEARLNALPLVVTHGWPSSVIEQLKIIDPRGPGAPSAISSTSAR